MFICKFTNKQNSESTYSLRIALTFADFAYILRIPLIFCGIHLQFADSTCICGFHLHFADSNYILRNPLTVAESKTTSCICLLQNPQQNKCADKIYVTGICMRNPLKLCIWKPLTFWNTFGDLSLESKNIQTQNCAPIQCKFWPRIGNKVLFSKKNFKPTYLITVHSPSLKFRICPIN